MMADFALKLHLRIIYGSTNCYYSVKLVPKLLVRVI